MALSTSSHETDGIDNQSWNDRPMLWGEIENRVKEKDYKENKTVEHLYASLFNNGEKWSVKEAVNEMWMNDERKL